MTQNIDEKLKQLNRKIKELEALINIQKAVVSTLNINQLLNLVMDMMTSLVWAEVGAMLLYDPLKNDIFPRVTWGLNYEILNNIKHKSGKTFLEWLLKTKNTVEIKDLKNDIRFKCQEDIYSKLKSLLCSPLRSKNKLVGVLVLANKTTANEIIPFSKDDVTVFNVAVNQIATAIDNAVLYEEVSNLKTYNENIINSIPSGVITTDLNGKVITYNKSAEYILNIPESKIIGKSCELLFEKRYNFNFNIIQIIKNGENLLNYELTLEKDNEETIVIGLSSSILKNIKNKTIGMVLVIEDLTEKKILENQIKRADQLSALGEMSAGIAHEIKNPLTSIRGFTQLLPMKIDDKTFQKKYVKIITSEVSRLNEIVERLLSFARPNTSGFQEINIVDAIKNTLSLLHFQIDKAKVKVQTKFTEVPKVNADSQQLEQVFINLLINSIQAMPKGGTIEIVNGIILRKDLQNVFKEFISVKVSDTGKGISDKEIKKLFNPFFTTKDSGTGLGLSISNQIIQEHGGSIEVNSRLGKGTTFTVYLPTSE